MESRVISELTGSHGLFSSKWSTQAVEFCTYVLAVGKKLDIDICKDSQRLYFRLTKGFVDLYESDEIIHVHYGVAKLPWNVYSESSVLCNNWGRHEM